MKDFLNPLVYQEINRHRDLFLSNTPFKHVVIDNFFEASVAEDMLSQFPSEPNPEKLVNEFGAPNPKSQISNVRDLGGIYAIVDDYIQSHEFIEAMIGITGIADLRYDPWYYGAGTHENFHGAGLDPHYDFNIHPISKQHRRINAILYLNKEWDPSWGGSIAFHSDPWNLDDDKIKDIQPLFNRCVIFETTERSWHSVPTVDLPVAKRSMSRKSFTIYMYTELRPSDELAPEHATVYVQSGLPNYIRAGHTLSEKDEKLIRSNIIRRHNYLRAMYDREYDFSRQISQLKALLDERTRYPAIPVIGYAKVIDVLSPLYNDNWMGSEFHCRVIVRENIKGVEITGWSSDLSEQPINLTITLNNRAPHLVQVNGGLFSSEIGIEFDKGSEVDLRLTADTVRRASGNDERLISVIINQIKLIH